MAPARAAYADFFEALEEGQLSDEQAARLEADVAAGAASDKRYEALSSLSYGYFALARASTNAIIPSPMGQARATWQMSLLLYAASITSPLCAGSMCTTALP